MKALILAVTLFLFIGPMQHCTRADEGSSLVVWFIQKGAAATCAVATMSVVDPKAKPLTYIWTARPVGHDDERKTFPTKDAAIAWVEANYCQVDGK